MDEQKNLGELQKVRKELKEWESAFNLVHRRKPTKDDIDQAPSDIKEKYKVYFHMKRGNEKGKEGEQIKKDKETEQSNATTASGSEIWGVEFNKKPSKTNQLEDDPESEKKISSLDKLGSKLFSNAPLSALSMDAKMFRNRNFSSDASFTSSSQKDLNHEKKMGNVTGRQGDKSLSDLEAQQNEFALTGSIFKQAQKRTKKNISNSSTHTPTQPVLGMKYCRPKKSNISSSFSIDVNQFEDPDKDTSFENDNNFSQSSSLLNSSFDNIDTTSRFQEKTKSKKIQNLFQTETCEKRMSVHEGAMNQTRGVNSTCVDDFTNSKRQETVEKTSKSIVSQKKAESSMDFDSLPYAASEDGPQVKASQNDKETNISLRSARTNSSTESHCATDEIGEKQIDACGLKNKQKFLESRQKRKSDASEEFLQPAKKSRVTSSISDEDKASEATTSLTNVKKKDVHKGKDVDVSSIPAKSSVSTSRKRNPASMNENYVCLNMKKKGYRRKGGGMTSFQLKRKQWKAKMAARSQSYGSNKCFKCGQEGHWANKCKVKSAGQYKTMDPSASAPVEESEFPSLRDAAFMARGIKSADSQSTAEIDPDDITDIEAAVVREFGDDTTAHPGCSSLDTVVKDIEKEMKDGLSAFGLSEFREGQETSISRILRGLSTLVVLATGGGKSLCYQLPAFLYGKHLNAITLVISPLVSLMEDQVTGLPPGVNGRCLHSGMTKTQQESVLTSLKEGGVHFLLVSPEAVVSGGGASQSCLPPPNRLPPIAFACIDEAHCLSEWSHNFRPSYLRVCKVLRRRYGINCFLGLTATATSSTCQDVARHLAITDSAQATVRGGVIPDNLVLSVSRDEDKDEALVSMLSGPRFKSCPSIIIYCARRDQTTRVAALIRTSLQKTVDLYDTAKNDEIKTTKGRGGKKTSKSATKFDPSVWTADSYHAGLPSSKRRSVQKAFMTGRLRVVVATVAFGMGLDKADVRAVIHYSMAKSFESYVQEIGRSGRDGLRADCHTLLGREDQDVREHQKHTYANSVDHLTVKKLVHGVFKICRCREIYAKASEDSSEVESEVPVCGGHERSLVIEDIVHSLDVKEEVISTLLCYLELHYPDWLENLGNVYSRCRLQCYGGPSQLQDVAKKCPPVAVAIARQKKDGKVFSEAHSLEFDVIDLCDVMGWQSGTVKRELKALQWTSGTTGWRKTGVMVELDQLAFHFRSRGDLDSNITDSVVDFLYSRTARQEKIEITQLNSLTDALRSVSHKNYWMCNEEADMARSNRLKATLVDFFRKETNSRGKDETETSGAMDDDTLEERNQLGPDTNNEPDAHHLQTLHQDIRSFVSLYGQEHQLTGRVIARIFQGIPSPRFPAETWGRVRRFWRCHLHDMDFNVIVREATGIIVGCR